MLLVCLLAWMGALRHVYRVGTTWNDHAVAGVVTTCFAWAAVALPIAAAVPVSFLLFGLFWSVDRPHGVPGWWWWTVGVGSQFAYALTLWGLAFSPLGLLSRLYGHGDAWLALPAAWAAWNVAWTVQRRHRVTHHVVPGLPIRIVQLSDLHLSGLMNRRELGAVITRTNALRPDLVVLTGDHITPFGEADPSPLFDALRGLTAPALACLGNHDLPVREALIAGMAQAGVPHLIDAAVVLHDVEVAGVDFHWSGLAARVPGQLPAPLPARFRVLLAHDPRVARHVPPGRFDLILSGHTHGGQVSLECVGVRLSLLGLLGARDHGWFQDGATRHYVHAGNWLLGLPPRLGVAPEIAVFEGGSARP